MSDLVAFLNARLDEDEATAKAAKGSYPTGRVYHSGAPALNGWWAQDADGAVRPISLAEGRHAARHDPARALREVEANRSILARHEHDNVDCFTCGHDDDDGTYLNGWCREARALGAIYSDHPDYRESEWIPEVRDVLK